MDRLQMRYKKSPPHASQKRLFGQTEIYLMGTLSANPVYWFRSKCGISDSTGSRRAQVDKRTSGAVYVLFRREVVFGWACEQLLHFVYQLQNAPMPHGSGRSEWHWNFNPIFGTWFLWLAVSHGWHFGWYWHWGAYFLPFVWLDGFLWLLLFRFLGWALCGLFLWGVYKMGGIEAFSALVDALGGWAFEAVKNFSM